MVCDVQEKRLEALVKAADDLALPDPSTLDFPDASPVSFSAYPMLEGVAKDASRVESISSELGELLKLVKA